MRFDYAVSELAKNLDRIRSDIVIVFNHQDRLFAFSIGRQRLICLLDDNGFKRRPGAVPKLLRVLEQACQGLPERGSVLMIAVSLALCTIWRQEEAVIVSGE